MTTDEIDAAIKSACGSARLLDSYSYEDVYACVAKYCDQKDKELALAKNLLGRAILVTADVGEELTLEEEIRQFLST